MSALEVLPEAEDRASTARLSVPRIASGNAHYRKQTEGGGLQQLPAPPHDLALSGTLHPASALVEAIIRRGDSPETRRAYTRDLQTYAEWLGAEDLAWDAVMVDDLDRYREWLAERYARATVNRRLTVVRSLYGEAARRDLLLHDPAVRLRALRGRDERDGGVLTRGEARQLLAAVRLDLDRPSRHLLARRDLAILSVLLRTGLRRSELVGLRIGSLEVRQGHHILTIHGKGNVVRTAKVPVDVHRVIEEWVEAAAAVGLELGPQDPLFVEVAKGGRLPGRRPLSDRAVYDIVRRRLVAARLTGLGPHAMRATFVTLALEGGAPLHVVQHGAGHADPRTTERYWRRKGSLDDNAVDYVRL